jgi:ATP-dependent DNA ligase
MHPTAARELPADQRNWAFEPKWDGYRALGHLVGGELALRSRNGVDMAGWFPELAGRGRRHLPGLRPAVAGRPAAHRAALG